MTLTKDEAIAAARAYADREQHPAWREGSVRIVRVVVRGHDCWRVMADDAPRPGDTWLDEELFDGGQSYLMDVTTGECIGSWGVGGYYLFRAGDYAPAPLARPGPGMSLLRRLLGVRPS